MPDEQTPKPDEETTPPATPETPSDETPKPDEKPDEKPTMTLDEALAEVTKTRGEAANYRTRARAAEDALKNAKSMDEVNEIVAAMTSDRVVSERALIAENVALKAGLPEALAARLQGTTREEMEADAKALAALIPAPEETPVRLKGGLTPDESGTETSDPGELARKHAPRR